MYKLKQELPKEFKIKVNPEQSEALQKHLFSIGCIFGFSQIVDISNKYLFVEDKNISHSSDRLYFKRIKIPQIKFKDYFEKVEETKETSFPEKWCILVTEDNYKELDVWMHRNWKNYKCYLDTWEISKNGLYFLSQSDTYYCQHQDLLKDYTLITTEQFRKQFGKLVVHEVEFFSYENETKTQGTKPGEKEYIVANMYVIGSDKWEYKAKYYKEKSDKLRKENFDLNFKIGNLYGEINSQKEQISALKNNAGCKLPGMHEIQIKSLRDEIRQLKTTIAEKDVTIERVRKENDQLNHEVLSKSSICIEKAKEVIALENMIYSRNKEIKTLKNIIAENNVTISKQRQDIDKNNEYKESFIKIANIVDTLLPF